MTIQPQVSLIISVTEDAPGLRQIHEAYADAMTTAGIDCEMIYVLDGHMPGSQDFLATVQEQDPRVRTLSLARRFGEATALMLGVRQARSPILATVPQTPQVEPAEIPRLLRMLMEKPDLDVVVARREAVGRANLRQSIRRSVFAKLAALGSGLSLSDLGCRLRVFRREVAEHLDIYGDQQHFLPILAARRGYKVVEVPVSPSTITSRVPQSARTDVLRLLDMAATLFLVNFVHRPLRFFGIIGMASLALGLLWTGVLVVQRFFFDVPLGDRPALMFSMLMVALGIQVIIIGLVGEIIIFTRAKDLKNYFVDRVIN